MRDISSGFDAVIDLILQGFRFVYDTLDSITFHGISLLDFILWVLALSIILPILITLLSSDHNGVELAGRASLNAADKKAKKFQDGVDEVYNDMRM